MSTQKLSKTEAKLKGFEKFWERFYQGIRKEKGTSQKIIRAKALIGRISTLFEKKE